MAHRARAAFVTLAGCAGLALLAPAAGAGAGTGGAQAATSRVDAAAVVLPPARTEGVAPTTAGVRKALAPAFEDSSLGRHSGAVVVDASRNRTVYSAGTAKPFVPASTLKLLTTAAALATLGPDHWFTTKAVGVGSTVVLVGGGDPLLAVRRSPDDTFPRRATLRDLAAGTARALRAKGVRSVALGYDATLFSGPAVNAEWESNYVPEGIAAPTSALWVDQGRLEPRRAKRAASPALAAAKEFAALLRESGVMVAAPKAMSAPAAATGLAQVRSAPLGEIVEHVNLYSDNDGAEVLLRHVGLATNKGGSYAGGAAGVRATLAGLGLDLRGARLEDGSGLSRTNQVPLQALAGVVRVAASGARPELRHLLTGLPVAGFSGSLEDRFTGPGTVSGSGLVRAKTGTLTGIHSLAGLVRDRTGTVLVFALATDSASSNRPLEARAALDRAASALASCGCG